MSTSSPSRRARRPPRRPPGRGAWLLEIYGDAASADLSAVDGVLRLLCDHAVRPTGGLRADRRSTQQSLRAVQ